MSTDQENGSATAGDAVRPVDRRDAERRDHEGHPDTGQDHWFAEPGIYECACKRIVKIIVTATTTFTATLQESCLPSHSGLPVAGVAMREM